jgi:hypothetical protein
LSFSSTWLVGYPHWPRLTWKLYWNTVPLQYLVQLAPTNRFNFFGLRITQLFFHPGNSGQMETVAAIVPLWMVVAATSLLPGVRLRKLYKSRHRQCENACIFCGYDLRATPDRCPECGIMPAKS